MLGTPHPHHQRIIYKLEGYISYIYMTPPKKKSYIYMMQVM